MGPLFLATFTDGEQGFLAEGLEKTTAGLGSVSLLNSSYVYEIIFTVTSNHFFSRSRTLENEMRLV